MLEKGLIKPSGVNIDCNYMIWVSDYVPVRLPRPRKRPPLRDIDGEVIPIITVTTEPLQ